MNVGERPGAPVDEDELLRRVRTVLSRDAQTPVLLKADEAVPYGRVITAMSLLDRAGAAKVGFLTDPVGARNGDRPRAPR